MASGPETLPLETQRAIDEAALKLTEGRMRAQTEQALKHKGSRFFEDVIFRAQFTSPKLEHLRIEKKADKKTGKTIEIIGTPGGVEVAISTKTTRRTKTTIKFDVKTPTLDVAVGAKINWLTPRIRAKNRENKQGDGSERRRPDCLTRRPGGA